MRRPIVALTALLMGAVAAAAADLRTPLKAPPLMTPGDIWSGFYIGANLGGGWANANMDFSLDGSPVFASVDNSLSGMAGGLQAGFNWQSGTAVFSVEA